jgi:hypothetical protein
MRWHAHACNSDDDGVEGAPTVAARAGTAHPPSPPCVQEGHMVAASLVNMCVLAAIASRFAEGLPALRSLRLEGAAPALRQLAGKPRMQGTWAAARLAVHGKQGPSLLAEAKAHRVAAHGRGHTRLPQGHGGHATGGALRPECAAES